jgi:hypothetical protein
MTFVSNSQNTANEAFVPTTTTHLAVSNANSYAQSVQFTPVPLVRNSVAGSTAQEYGTNLFAAIPWSRQPQVSNVGGFQSDSTTVLNATQLAPALRQPVKYVLSSMGVAGSGGSGITTYFKKRARDSGSSTPYYVTWVTSTVTQAYPSTPPYGGPLVDITLVDIWQV